MTSLFKTLCCSGLRPTVSKGCEHADCDRDHCGVFEDTGPEVNISPKISISAQPLKMALHRNPAMHGSRMVIFLHDSKKALF